MIMRWLSAGLLVAILLLVSGCGSNTSSSSDDLSSFETLSPEEIDQVISRFDAELRRVDQLESDFIDNRSRKVLAVVGIENTGRRLYPTESIWSVRLEINESGRVEFDTASGCLDDTNAVVTDFFSDCLLLLRQLSRVS